MWPSGQSTWAPCAVKHNALSGRGSNLSPGVSTYQRIMIIPMHTMNRELIPGRKRGVDGFLYKLTVADAMTSSIKVLAVLT